MFGIFKIFITIFALCGFVRIVLDYCIILTLTCYVILDCSALALIQIAEGNYVTCEYFQSHFVLCGKLNSVCLSALIFFPYE